MDNNSRLPPLPPSQPTRSSTVWHFKRKFHVGCIVTYFPYCPNGSFSVDTIIYRVFIKYCVFPGYKNILFSTLVPSVCTNLYLAFLSVSVFVRLTARWQIDLQQIRHSSEKRQHFKEKTQYLINTLYMIIR